MVGRVVSGNLRAGPRRGRRGISFPAELARSTRRSYDQTLTGLVRELAETWPPSGKGQAD